MPVNRMRLHALADREFKREFSAPDPKPATSKFRAVRLALSKYDPTWDRKRGSAARMMAVLLREDDNQLATRVCENEQTARNYRAAAAWLVMEARYLRKLAGMMDTAAGRLGVVLERCGPSPSSPESL